MAFLVPDRDVLRPRRCYPADVLDWVPGEVVDLGHRRSRPSSPTSTPTVLRGAAERHEVAERIGLNPTPTAADDLVTALVKLGVLALRLVRKRPHAAQNEHSRVIPAA